MERQAEISLKAGIREVVDFIDEHREDVDALEKWEAFKDKLKEVSSG